MIAVGIYDHGARRLLYDVRSDPMPFAGITILLASLRFRGELAPRAPRVLTDPTALRAD